MRGTILLACVAALCVPAASARPQPLSAEARTAAAMTRASATTPELRLFLQAMPKGGDLHNHAPGAVYAEDLIDWAGALDMCVHTATGRLSPPPCAKDQVPARDLGTRDYRLYSRVIDTVSTRGIEQGVGDPMIPGYDRFFFSIDSSGAPRDAAKSFAIAREAASYDNLQYLELMTGGGDGQAAIEKAAEASGLDGTDFDALDRAILPAMPAAVAHARAEYDRYEAEGAKLLGCGTASPSPACMVAVRYINVGFRLRPPPTVFAALAFSFALAQADPRFVGVNIVGPEHDPVARRDYALHMRMIAYLHRLYPKVPLSLHAGELALGMVPPRDLRTHIAQAVDVAAARRIGHGIDIAEEADAPALLARMARDRIAVEINLTSNAVILGIKGKDHPLALYRKAGVPVVLGTDDAGLTRGDMTNEFVRAVQEQGLDYPALKQMVRNSLEYAFLPGASLWRSTVGAARVTACAIVTPEPAPACTRFLSGSARATQQYALERKLAAFEAAYR